LLYLGHGLKVGPIDYLLVYVSPNFVNPFQPHSMWFAWLCGWPYPTVSSLVTIVCQKCPGSYINC